jgi:uncharacterized protein YbjQ (UPF0145 family)
MRIYIMRKPIALLLGALFLALASSPVMADDGGTSASQARPADMLLTTTGTLEGYKVKEYKGIVRGITVRQPTIGQSLSANLERLKGGRISAYVNMCETARRHAYEECILRARELGANAIIGIAYDSASFEHGTNVETEVICYGTAVIAEKDLAASTNDAAVSKVAELRPAVPTGVAVAKGDVSETADASDAKQSTAKVAQTN